jgi:sugar lactone lactonase YvrE
VEIFDDRRCVLGEAPWYEERTDRFGWVDILGRRLHWRGCADPQDAGSTDTPQDVGAAVPRVNGGLALCLTDGVVLADPDGALHVLDDFAEADAAAGRPRPAGAPRVRSNDARADRSGRLWVGTVAYDETPGAATLYRLEPGSPRPVPVLPGVSISNGLGWSSDGERMYYIDTPTRRVEVFRYDPATGEPTDRRTLATVDEADGVPDGLCVDAEGGIWVALHGGGAVRRYLPDGTLDRQVPVPTPRVTSCAFGGAGYDLLLVTTAAQGVTGDPGAGLTYVHRPGDVVGRPVDRFGG